MISDNKLSMHICDSLIAATAMNTYEWLQDRSLSMLSERDHPDMLTEYLSVAWLLLGDFLLKLIPVTAHCMLNLISGYGYSTFQTLLVHLCCVLFFHWSALCKLRNQLRTTGQQTVCYRLRNQLRTTGQTLYAFDFC